MIRISLLLVLQLLLTIAAGFFSGDHVFSILVASIGVAFNLLVSLNLPQGFLLGTVYAITNGVLSWYSGAYASCIFMFLLQTPMAIYSYISWKRKKQKALRLCGV